MKNGNLLAALLAVLASLGLGLGGWALLQSHQLGVELGRQDERLEAITAKLDELRDDHAEDDRQTQRLERLERRSTWSKDQINGLRFSLTQEHPARDLVPVTWPEHP